MNDKFNLFLDCATVEDCEDDARACGLDVADFPRKNPGMPPCVKLTGTKEQFRKFAEYNAIPFSDIESDLEPVKRPHDKSDVKYVIKNSKGEVISAPSSDENYLWDRVTRMENRGQKGLSVVVFNESLKEAFVGKKFLIWFINANFPSDWSMHKYMLVDGNSKDDVMPIAQKVADKLGFTYRRFGIKEAEPKVFRITFKANAILDKMTKLQKTTFHSKIDSMYITACCKYQAYQFYKEKLFGTTYTNDPNKIVDDGFMERGSYQDLEQCDKDFHMTFDTKQFVDATGFDYGFLNDSLVNESLTEEVNMNNADFSIDFVGFCDEDLEKFDVLKTYYVTVDDIKSIYKDSYDFAVKRFNREYFEEHDGKALNGSMFYEILRGTVEKKYNPQKELDRDTYNKYYDNGFGYEHIQLINKKLFPSSIEQLQRDLGRMLLPKR